MALAGHQKPQEILTGTPTPWLTRVKKDSHCSNKPVQWMENDSYSATSETLTVISFYLAVCLCRFMYVPIFAFLCLRCVCVCVSKLTNLSSSRGSRPCSLWVMAAYTGRWGRCRPEVESFGPVMCGEKTWSQKHDTRFLWYKLLVCSNVFQI